MEVLETWLSQVNADSAHACQQPPGRVPAIGQFAPPLLG